MWNLEIDGGSAYNFNGTAILYDLDLVLYDLTAGGEEIVASRSSIDNTENIHVGLTSGHEYRIQVQRGADQGDFNWDFALAWQVQVDVDGDMVPDLLDDFPDDCSECRDAEEDSMGDNFEQCIIDADSADAYESVTDVLPEDDFDGDGITNLDEFINGSDPTQFDLTGDINDDCKVDMLDYLILRNEYGTVGDSVADINGNGQVDMLDYLILRSTYGTSCP